MRALSSSSLLASSGLLTLTIALAVPSGQAVAAEAVTTVAASAMAQEQVLPDDDPAPTEGEILVIAQTLRGAVDAPQPPLMELGAEEIAAYGASSIADLIAALGPQTGSARGQGGGFPVILVNGARVSSFRELRSYPPEAIEKVEVFPEEVAQRYGYSADQRVVNFILKRNYQSSEVEVEYGQPWEGGTSTKEAEATYLQIAGDNRFNFNLALDDTSLLTEAERGVVQAVVAPPGEIDPARFRSLVSDTAGLEATANWSTRLADNGTSLSLNATFERSDSLRLQGLDSVLGAEDPLKVDTRSDTYGAGGAINAPLGEWQLTATVDGSRVNSSSRIDRNGDRGYDEANTETDSASAKVTANGRPIYLPAGDVSVTFDAGYDWTRITSEDTRRINERTRLLRGDLNAGVNLSVPITSVRDDVLSAVGDVNLNASAGINYLSDFGTLTDWTVGLTWAPTETLNFNGSYIARETAPSLGQLGNAEIATQNVQVYDFNTGETVEATLITGGNRNLPAQTQGDWKFGVMWQLPEMSFLERSNISVDYYRTKSEDVAAGFPLLTPTIEAAFPGRVTRNDAGRIVSIDQRPVTFAEQKSERIQVGFNLSGPLGKSRPADQQNNNGGGFPFAGGGFPGGQAGGQPGGFDPARFAAARERICVKSPDGSLAALELTPEILAELPEPMQQRLRRADGTIDAAAFAEIRQRMCSQDGPPFGAQGGQGGQGGPGAGGPPFGGPGAGGPPFGGPGGGRPPFAGGGRGPGGPGGPGGFMPGGGGGGGGDGRGRWFFNVNYTYEISNEVLIAPGGPLLDLLDGDSLADSGRPRHSVNGRAGMFYGGFGSQIGGRYTGSSRVEGKGVPGSSTLFFEDYVKFDWRIFADLNQQASLIKQVPLLANTRISLDVNNIFDARQRVTDTNGVVPLRYQPYLIDPRGRTFSIELRKLF